jgi:uncharacterized protein YkwD
MKSARAATLPPRRWAAALLAAVLPACSLDAPAPAGRPAAPALPDANRARADEVAPDDDAPAIPPEHWPGDAPADFETARRRAEAHAAGAGTDPFAVAGPGTDPFAYAPSAPIGLGPDPDPSPPPTPEPPPSLDELADALLKAHNAERARVGLPPFRASAALMAAAQAHAEDMAGRDAMSHVGSDGSQPYERVERQGYRFTNTGENVAGHYRTVDAVMGGWMHSAGHKANILGKFREIGVGVAESDRGLPYWCVVFGSRFVALDPDAAAAEVVERVNRERAKENLAPLAPNPILMGAARRHAFAMAQKRAAIAHDDRGLPPIERARQAGYRFRRSGLSSGLGEATPEELVFHWLGDVATRKYLMGDYAEIGVGYAADPQGTPYWSVIVADPAPAH